MHRDFRPTSADELSKIQQQQFALLGRRWSADDERTAMVTGNPELPTFGAIRFVTVVEIEDADGDLAYEAISHCHGLHGAVFRAGTTVPVGELCQHDLEMCDPGQDALLKTRALLLEQSRD